MPRAPAAQVLGRVEVRGQRGEFDGRHRRIAAVEERARARLAGERREAREQAPVEQRRRAVLGRP